MASRRISLFVRLVLLIALRHDWLCFLEISLVVLLMMNPYLMIGKLPVNFIHFLHAKLLFWKVERAAHLLVPLQTGNAASRAAIETKDAVGLVSSRGNPTRHWLGNYGVKLLIILIWSLTRHLIRSNLIQVTLLLEFRMRINIYRSLVLLLWWENGQLCLPINLTLLEVFRLRVIALGLFSSHQCELIKNLVFKHGIFSYRPEILFR